MIREERYSTSSEELTDALNGNVQKVANNIFVFAPENVAIFADGENKPYNFGGGENGSNPWK